MTPWLRGKQLLAIGHLGSRASSRAVPYVCYNILDEFTASSAAPLANHSHCVACSDLGATTASPADPILTVAKARLSRDPGATVAGGL